MYTVYKITNSRDSRYYIGVHKTEDENDRYFGSGLIVRRMISKYGIDNFKKEILFKFDTKEEAFLKEKELVDITDVNCVNIAKGGHGGATFMGRHHSDETKRIIGEKARGRIISAEARKKISEANRRRVLSDLTKKKLGDIRRKWFKNPENHIKISIATKAGMTLEVRKKISIAKRNHSRVKQ